MLWRPSVPDNEFQGKTGIVTGTTGIGAAIAKRFARAGARIVACGNDTAANERLQSEANRQKLEIIVRACDVSEAGDVQVAIATAVERFGGLDLIVNAAGVNPYGTAEETSIEVWNRCFSVNVTSIFLFAHFGVPELKKRGGGAIVNLASVQGYACQPGVVAYATSKAAVHALTRALALDYAHDGIRVNSISPGSIATPMLESSARKFSPGQPVEEVFARFGEAHPMGRVGTPEEVAELAAFLASDRAAFCTGADYKIDGGLTAAIGVK
jgi:NAD(P)-dependent dehydrogenase (short-subunit alcohol dehydrogenase family)